LFVSVHADPNGLFVSVHADPNGLFATPSKIPQAISGPINEHPSEVPGHPSVVPSYVTVSFIMDLWQALTSLKFTATYYMLLLQLYCLFQDKTFYSC
jgi:hypothetical protein